VLYSRAIHAPLLGPAVPATATAEVLPTDLKSDWPAAVLTLMSAADISSDMPYSAMMKPDVLVAPCSRSRSGHTATALHTTFWRTQLHSMHHTCMLPGSTGIDVINLLYLICVEVACCCVHCAEASLLL
jgi:hypothetical protein